MSAGIKNPFIITWVTLLIALRVNLISSLLVSLLMSWTLWWLSLVYNSSTESVADVSFLSALLACVFASLLSLSYVDLGFAGSGYSLTLICYTGRCYCWTHSSWSIRQPSCPESPDCLCLFVSGLFSIGNLVANLSHSSYIAFFATSWGPVAWVITGEIFVGPFWPEHVMSTQCKF